MKLFQVSSQITLVFTLTGVISTIFNIPFIYPTSQALAQTAPDLESEKERIWNEASQHLQKGNYREASESLQQLLVVFQKIGDRVGEGQTLNLIGATYYYRGNYPQALEYYQQALDILEEFNSPVDEGSILSNIGEAYNNMGQYALALDYFEEALSFFAGLENPYRQGTLLNNIASIYENVGQYEQALKSYQDALVLREEAKDIGGVAQTLNNIGVVYTYLGEISQDDNLSQENLNNALEYYQKALTLFEEIDNLAEQGRILSNLGGVYSNLSQYSQALEYYQRGLVIRREVEDRLGERVTLNNIGGVYDSLGQYEQALEFYEQSLSLARQIGDRRGEGDVLSNIGHTLSELGKLAEAQNTLFQAIEVQESLRPSLNDPAQVSLFERQASAYNRSQQVLIALDNPEKALEISERGRSRALVNILFRKSSSALEELQIPPSINIEEIKQIAQQKEVTLVEYSLVSRRQLYIWVIQPQGKVHFRYVELPENTFLPELVKASRQSIGARGRSVSDSTPEESYCTNCLQQLHQILIEPIAELLPEGEEEQVIFIPHQELFLVPFAALQDPNYQYLIEKHTILTVPSIQTLSLTSENNKVDTFLTSGSPEALVVGNPVMPKLRVGKELQPLSPLSGAEREAKQIAKMLDTEPIIGSEATETAIVQRMPNAKVIHLATHGLLDDFSGIGSPGAIALTPSGQDDGFLTTTEIMERFGQPGSTPLKAELVVLSACDTGSGDIKGEGVIGLSRSLIAAGVPTIVVSLWQVPDDDTNLLMTEFYTNLYERKLDKAQAMRQAMLTMLKEDRGNFDPIAWGAFTVIGEAE